MLIGLLLILFGILPIVVNPTLGFILGTVLILIGLLVGLLGCWAADRRSLGSRIYEDVSGLPDEDSI